MDDAGAHRGLKQPVVLKQLALNPGQRLATSVLNDIFRA
jgi:hypothetical protein